MLPSHDATTGRTTGSFASPAGAADSSRRRALVTLGALGVGLGTPGLASAATSDDQFSSELASAQNSTDFARLLRLARVPSLSLAVIERGRTRTQSVGVRRSGEPASATADTVYAAASLTKIVASYVILGLVHEKRLDLDAPVHTYLALPDDDAASRAITARHLLSHSGGWRNWRFDATQRLTADFTPGSRWSYSGEGFFFLQRIAEQITGTAFAALARQRVFEPLGMTRSSLAPLPALSALLASGHDGRGRPNPTAENDPASALQQLMSSRGKAMDEARVEDLEAALRTASPTRAVLPVFLTINAAASMLTTANDFARFLQHLVGSSSRSPVSSAIVADMMKPQVRGNEAIQWGLGVGLEEVGTSRCAWQWGDNPGFKNFCWFDPAAGRAMVVFTNGDRGARVYERGVRALTVDDHPGFLWA
ncbi:MAG TPA: serine hydrolase domain-containing protein [Gemmatimonas sp.]|uniref:serine hydrolase domain-containing protein n=1 Tax=Gemmatimonas sp. TaxID=1962908 RepID=UPI002ED7D576